MKGLQRLSGFDSGVKIFFFLILFLFYTNWIFAQDDYGDEETTVSLRISKIGVVEAPAFIRNELLYLPVIDIFTFLKIQNTPSPGYDSVAGFFINEQSRYLIDRGKNSIRYQDKIFDLAEGALIRTENNLYLRSDVFGQVFGMYITFDFHNLVATLTTRFDLPATRDMKQAMMRRDLSRLKGELKADTTVGRKYPLFHFGMADWSVTATQLLGGMNNVGVNLALGSVVAGGEANVFLTYRNQQNFNLSQQRYLWHYANNNRPALRQVKLGMIETSSTSTIYAPLVGMQFTNTPTTFRRSFGTYTLSDYTEPGWGVELYVNNALVDYLKADASGFFTFEVPLVYGNSSILLRFYGPWGEERSREKSILIPFNFLPVRKFEYTVTAAMVQNRRSDLFSRANFSYGLNARMTVGGGVEYLSSVRNLNTMPFVDFSVRLASSLLVTGEYVFGVKARGILSCRLPGNIQVELNYAQYNKNQTAISARFREQRKVMISIPVRTKGFTSLVRFTLDQVLVNNFRNLSSELLISGNFYGTSLNLTTVGQFYDPVHAYVTSTLSLGIRLPANIYLTPQAQYDYSNKKFVATKVELERKFFNNGLLKMSYEHNFVMNISNVQIGLRYAFPFAQAGVAAMFGKRNTSFVQTASGSLMVDARSKWMGAGNSSSVGKGGLLLIPFLDLNANGKRDGQEPRVAGLNLRITGGRTEQNIGDSTIRVFDLEPFANSFIEIDKSSFENIAWQIKKLTISVAIDPNQFKPVEIPIAVFGEGSGMVYTQKDREMTGQGRIVISFYRSDSTFAGQTLTEPDGFFSFLGLTPGDYFVKVDKEQTRNLRMSVTPEFYPITIFSSIDGDQAGGLDFILKPLDSKADSSILFSPLIPRKAELGQIVFPNSNGKIMPDSTSQVTSGTDLNTGISILAGVFRNQTNAINTRFRLQSIVNLPVSILFESGSYYVRIYGIRNEAIARKLLMVLTGNGFPGAVIQTKL